MLFRSYFYDVGLASFLLGIETPVQMQRDPLKGNLFENLIVMEFLKQRYNQVKTNNLYFFRDSNGNEIDIFAEFPKGALALEIKAGQTISTDFFKSLDYFETASRLPSLKKVVVYGGKQDQIRSTAHVYSHRHCAAVYRSMNE